MNIMQHAYDSLSDSMKLKSYRLIGLAVYLCLACALPCRAQDDSDWDWVDKHFAALLQEFLPINADAGVSLTYRSHRDLYTDVPEYSLVFNRNWQTQRIDVIVRMADGVSLYDQTMALHRQHPAESFESIKKKLKVKEWRGNSQTCPAASALYEAFYRLRLPMESTEDKKRRAKGEEMITLHPTVHTFITDISGGSLELTLTDQDHPFVRWAVKARRALEPCIASPQRRDN
jgi:hypothetical protein